MYKIVFQPLALKDIQEIVDYYDVINPKITDAFIEELENKTKIIQQTPLSFPKKLGDVRALYMKIFRYGVYFKIYSKEKRITIIAVIHTSRNSKIWQKR